MGVSNYNHRARSARENFRPRPFFAAHAQYCANTVEERILILYVQGQFSWTPGGSDGAGIKCNWATTFWGTLLQYLSFWGTEINSMHINTYLHNYYFNLESVANYFKLVD